MRNLTLAESHLIGGGTVAVTLKINDSDLSPACSESLVAHNNGLNNATTVAAPSVACTVSEKFTFARQARKEAYALVFPIMREVAP